MNTRRQLVLAAVGAAGVTVLFFFILLSPKLHSIGEVSDDLDAARQEEQSLQAQLVHLQQVKRNATQTMAKLAAVSQFLPSSPDLPGFIRLMQDAATKAGVDLQSIAPGQPVALPGSTGVSTITVTLNAQGGFHRIEDFMARMESLDRAVEVYALALTPTQSELSNQVVLQTTITLQMFVVDANARVGAAAGVVPGASPTPKATP
jgi:Tfp pilus assembly protein PilO